MLADYNLKRNKNIGPWETADSIMYSCIDVEAQLHCYVKKKFTFIYGGDSFGKKDVTF